MEDKKTTPSTWIITIIVFVVCFYVGYSLFSGGIPFEGKSERCKKEAQDRAVSLRDATLKSLKLIENPTEAEVEEIEELERKQGADLVSRDDYDYFYQDCMR